MLATAASGAALLIPIWLMTGSLANRDREEFDWTIRNMRIGFVSTLLVPALLVLDDRQRQQATG